MTHFFVFFFLLLRFWNGETLSHTWPILELGHISMSEWVASLVMTQECPHATSSTSITKLSKYLPSLEAVHRGGAATFASAKVKNAIGRIGIFFDGNSLHRVRSYRSWNSPLVTNVARTWRGKSYRVMFPILGLLFIPSEGIHMPLRGSAPSECPSK